MSALGTSIIAHVALVSMVIRVRRKKMPVSHHLVYMEHVKILYMALSAREYNKTIIQAQGKWSKISNTFLFQFSIKCWSSGLEFTNCLSE